MNEEWNTLIHISDCHNGQHGSEKKIDLLLQTIAKRHPDALVVHTGDWTDNGFASEYEQGNRLLAQNGFSLWMKKARSESGRLQFVNVPGNHDVGRWGNFFDAACRSRFVSRFAKNLHYPLVLHKCWLPFDLDLILLDSADRQDNEWFARGKIGKLQLDLLDRHLARLRQRLRVVALHHHPFEHGYFMELQDAERLASVLRGRIDLLLFGHKHQAAFWRDRLELPAVSAAPKSPDAGGYRVFHWDESRRLHSRWILLTPLQETQTGFSNRKKHQTFASNVDRL